ncbi:fumarylacetoacetate hydrolase family protein [Novosphingobium sp. PP1Y]|uniref:fumarylacetoacetate hydrolase family protein n=1 Tax=Novosphingobium sp. PP1Y TaxID=702113 RepID=UPI00020EF8DF|nr:fumarylacetoacetate hydrolase family protein [Novosphingobium sp. PP1Y]CCA90751.1 5-carboxymethyl-2-hydroxymuconate delta-isomerase [Novosphingobium sp. PP1Y]
MQIVRFEDRRGRGLAVNTGDGYRALWSEDGPFPGDLPDLIAEGADLMAIGSAFHAATPIDIDAVRILPPLPNPGKIICVGLNYVDHAAEGNFEVPIYPTIFARFASSLLAHGAPMARPPQSEQFDFEGELVAVIGMGGRTILREEALLHVAGYSIFNDGSVRDYQFRTPQWTMGKNFDGTGAFGPCFVPSAALAPGAKGLRLQTRLNGVVVQDASTDDMIFDIAELIALLSEAITLAPGDVIVTGTPAGVGFARKPPVWMKPGDICEVEIEGIGLLRNEIV